ncbi:unnamed protein product [Clonostachys chloroleuca]|uniref:Uncharacterized protein n=1 Tax=Clonostachys chloroleuca TaxID=1926264 RepID=A0AA35LSI9_9HYPO|nr:unnamed protein product [Clonostachys chloroleuca]
MTVPEAVQEALFDTLDGGLQRLVTADPRDPRDVEIAYEILNSKETRRGHGFEEIQSTGRAHDRGGRHGLSGTWVAAEWIINCGDILFTELNLVGLKHPELGPGLQQWELWRKRLAKFAQSESLGLKDKAKKHAAAALRLMEEPSEWERRASSAEHAIKEYMNIGGARERSLAKSAPYI